MLSQGENQSNDAACAVGNACLWDMLVSVGQMALQVSLPAQTVMVWGGLRGAETLALSLPTSLEYWWTIQSIAFGVVVFSLFVLAPTINLLVKKSLAGEKD